jgi:hypothetical protein
MSDLNRRLKKVESKLNVDKGQRIAEIVYFTDRPLPPDETYGNTTIRHVRFDDVIKRNRNE